MRKHVAAGLVVLGVFFAARGLVSPHSLNSRVTRLCMGKPSDGAMWPLIGGTLTVMIGPSLAPF